MLDKRWRDLTDWASDLVNEVEYLNQSYLWTSVLGAILLILYFFVRMKRPVIVWRNSHVLQQSIRTRRGIEIPRHLAAICLAAIVSALAIPAARPVVEVSEAVELSVIIWIHDGSTSMETEDIKVNGGNINRWDAAALAIKASADQIPEEALLFAVSYGTEDDDPFTDISFPIRSADKLVDVIDRLRRGGKTPISLGLERAINACESYVDLVREHREFDDDDYPCTLILLSDGACSLDVVRFCQSKMEDIAAKGLEKGIRTHTISWGSVKPGDVNNRPRPESLQAVATAGGGQSVATGQVEALIDLYSEILPSVEISEEAESIHDTLVWGARIIQALLVIVFILGCILNPGSVHKVK